MASACNSFILDPIIRKAIKQLFSEVILVAFVLHFEAFHPYRIASDQQRVFTGLKYAMRFMFSIFRDLDMGICA